MVSFLNSIHTPLTQHVLDTHGTLDKYIGDGMMAFWNAPIEIPDHLRQLSARLSECSKRSRDDERRRFANPRGPPRDRDWNTTGPACVGNVGSKQRFDYSAIGDTVNAAARIEPLCKDMKVRILGFERCRGGSSPISPCFSRAGWQSCGDASRK